MRTLLAFMFVCLAGDARSQPGATGPVAELNAEAKALSETDSDKSLATAQKALAAARDAKDLRGEAEALNPSLPVNLGKCRPSNRLQTVWDPTYEAKSALNLLRRRILIMDVACATEHAAEGPAAAAKHDKSCLLMGPCVKSGYSVITAENKMLKLDAKGNQLALALIKASDKKADWKVAVVGTVSGDSIAVDSLKLR